MSEYWTAPHIDQAISDPELMPLTEGIEMRGGIDPSPDDPTSDYKPPTEARCRCGTWRPLFCLSLTLDETGAKRFLCDGCRSAIVRAGANKADILEAIGAPPTLVETIREAIVDPDQIVD